ncbi:MAG TPA: amidohydrolase family protein [Trebonia sp.]|jgi:N-acyl-D-aspartate/D-glutamate deacylase|nr:amidohydrolase family protein [Trebonia sp.]
MHDIVIRHGLVVDGTGAPPVEADVAIDGDRITEVGVVTEAGSREIDASDRIVTPGFVDIHTHLDAQLFWDPAATSSCWHGVTTVVLGNCGVTFAPVRPGQERYLAGMMDSVEDIPTDTIMAGLDWGWETYGDYLRALGRRPLGVNAGGMVGHSALRYYVMGDRSLDQGEPATEADIKAMAAVLDEAMDAGALGFSTSRSFMHTVPDGTPLPGTFALPDELAGIADVLARRGRGVIEVVPRIGERDGREMQNSRAEMAWMEAVSRACGRPLTFAITQSDRRPGLWSWVMDETSAARARGADLRPQTSARGSAILYGLASRTPYDALPTWASLMSNPYIERTVALADEALRARLATEAEQIVLSGPLAPKDPAKLYLMPPGEARYDVRPDNSLAAEAARRNTTPARAFLDFLVETDGRGLLYYPVLNQDLAAVREMITNPDVVIGLGDAGAHVALTMDAGLPSYVLSHWVRDEGTLGLALAVRKLTKEGADLFGIADRGLLTPGAFADVNVIDLGRLRLRTPELVHDFPLGAGRFVQQADGYDYTIVNGTVLVDHGELTDARAGRLVTAS